ncbi:hypothetical protein KIN20_016398 [Parelaphostrongylus tenuis]|uniref:Uncharacterized protein n=1 Tax=Parelaphostrongylus tenuis TaxID=148309 RepID=A0AAD5MJZ0_PARTN|nr:hypothetical protein KIN20_016398 [Parelaphostrongylus tenuis]
MDAYALGRCSDEVLVIRSPPQRSAGAPPGNVGTGVKVMLRKKRIITKTPNRACGCDKPQTLLPILEVVAHKNPNNPSNIAAPLGGNSTFMLFFKST